MNCLDIAQTVLENLEKLPNRSNEKLLYHLACLKFLVNDQS